MIIFVEINVSLKSVEKTDFGARKKKYFLFRRKSIFFSEFGTHLCGIPLKGYHTDVEIVSDFPIENV